MKINRRIVFGILLAGMLFLTGILLRDFLQENFVKPLALLLWIGNRLIASIDQSAYWAGLILVLVFISLLRYAKQQGIEEVESTGYGNATLDSIRHWRMLISLPGNEAVGLNFLKQAMQNLLKDIYAAKQPSQAPWKINQDIEQGDIVLPDSISEFLGLGPSANGDFSLMQRLQRLSQTPRRWARRWPKRDLADYHQSIAEVISFMEKELEKDNDK